MGRRRPNFYQRICQSGIWKFFLINTRGTSTQFREFLGQLPSHFLLTLWPQIIALLSLTAAAATFAIFVSDDFKDYVDKKFRKVLPMSDAMSVARFKRDTIESSQLALDNILSSDAIDYKKSPTKANFRNPSSFLIFFICWRMSCSSPAASFPRVANGSRK